MKKYLSLFALCLIVLSCRKEVSTEQDLTKDKSAQSISLRQAIAMMNSNVNNGMMGTLAYQTKTTNISLVGTPNYCTQNTNTAEGIIFATHGNTVYSANSGSSYIDMWTKNNGTVEGSGIAFRFPFKQGTNYTITIGVMNTATSVYPDQTNSLTRRPGLQIQLTNNAPLSPSCNTFAAPVTLVAPGPTATVPLSQSNNQASLRSINFSPTECYEFLRFSALPNMTGISVGDVMISSISITANSGPELIGATLTTDEQDTYSVQYGGLSINEQFNWSVSGSYEIIGSTTGPTAVIKCNGTAGGSISVGLNGCQAVAIRTFQDTSAPLPPIPPVLPGVTYFGKAVNGPRTYFFYGNGTSITAGVIVDPVKQFTVTHFIGAAITSTGNLTGRMYATDENGSAYTFVLSGMDFEPELL